jgi:hypothetical protein
MKKVLGVVISLAAVIALLRVILALVRKFHKM